MAIIETDRLILRRFTPDDLDDLAAIFEKPEVMKYLGYTGEPMSRDETETALLSMIKHWERHQFGRWAVILKETAELIGCSGLRSYENIAELVYLIDAPHWGKGLATEIASACLAFGFKKRHFENIIAFARPDNKASRNIMEKIGMRFSNEVTVFGIFVVQYEISAGEYFSARPAERVFQTVQYSSVNEISLTNTGAI